MKGFTKIQNDLLMDSKLDPMAKLVYVGLGYYDRGNGRGCFCKRTTLARLLNVSIYQLRKALRVLEEEGLIVIHKRYNGCTDIIKRVADNKTLEADENFKPNTIREENKVEEEVNAITPESRKEKTTDTASRLIPDAAEDPPIDLSATKSCHTRLQQLLTYAKWDKWFRDSWVIEEKRQDFILFVPKPYVADYIDQAFRQAIEKEFGKKLSIFSESTQKQKT